MENFDTDGAEPTDVHAMRPTRSTESFSIECGTCVATGTTACADCIVTHLLANDDGPIDLVTVPVDPPVTATERAVALFQRAGLLDEPVRFVSVDEFEHGVAARVGR